MTRKTSYLTAVLSLIAITLSGCSDNKNEDVRGADTVRENMTWLDMHGQGGEERPVHRSPCVDGGSRWETTRRYSGPEPSWVVNWRGGILKAQDKGYTVSRDYSSPYGIWEMAARDRNGYGMIVYYSPGDPSGVLLTSEGPCS